MPLRVYWPLLSYCVFDASAVCCSVMACLRLVMAVRPVGRESRRSLAAEAPQVGERSGRARTSDSNEKTQDYPSPCPFGGSARAASPCGLRACTPFKSRGTDLPEIPGDS